MNRDELKNAINKRGLKMSYIAEKLGISIQSMSSKINGKSEFKASELVTLTHILSLDASERKKIFSI